MEGWGFRNLLLSINLCKVSGYGGFSWRGIDYGDMIIVKYAEEWGGWYSKPVRDAHGCGLWKSVRMRGVPFFYSAFGLMWALIVKFDFGMIV